MRMDREGKEEGYMAEQVKRAVRQWCHAKCQASLCLEDG